MQPNPSAVLIDLVVFHSITNYSIMSFLSSRKYASLALITLVASMASAPTDAFAPPGAFLARTSLVAPSSALFGKKSARKGGGGGGKGGGKGRGQQPQEKQSVKDERFDAMTRQFMFTMVGLNKILPDKSKTILKNINLSFYPGAKIGLVGLNGSGKSTLLKIMAGVDTEFDGTARPLPGSSIGYLSQEPELKFETVQECVDEAVGSSRKIIDDYNNLGLKLGDPDITQDEMDKVMADMELLNNQIEAGNLWDLDRVVERAMDSLRVPPGDAKTAVLSGGEKRRVALCQLLLGNHDMLLLDEPTNHLDAESISWLEQFLADFKGTVVCISKYICVCVMPEASMSSIYLDPQTNLFISLSLVQLTTVTFSKTSLNGFWSSIAERVFHLRATTPIGWRPRTSVSKEKRRPNRRLPRLSGLSSNGSVRTPRHVLPRARLV
jgi:ABC-type Mn2+/Zn2+ transport system ATPase subunit